MTLHLKPRKKSERPLLENIPAEKGGFFSKRGKEGRRGGEKKTFPSIRVIGEKVLPKGEKTAQSFETFTPTKRELHSEGISRKRLTGMGLGKKGVFRAFERTLAAGKRAKRKK